MKPKMVRELLAIYYDKNNNKQPDAGEFLAFDIAEDISVLKKHFDSHLSQTNVTVYNPTKPINSNGREYLLGRVEPLESEHSKIIFFERIEDLWKIVDEAPVLGLQDPFFISNVRGYNIIGGVKIIEKDHKISYRTEFYRYNLELIELIDEKGNILPPFATGPTGMKDIRLICCVDGKIAVFTRPQGGAAGLGKIGFILISNLDELEEAIPKARIIENQFHSDEWGGANELHLLKNGLIGVIGHIAHYDNDVKHYYAMAFVYDPERHWHSHMEILTTADDFPPVEPKTSKMGKIIFSGGLHRNFDGTAQLYVGIGDVKSGKIKIHDPFWRYENQ